MPFESGGMSDKLGNRYEGLWIANKLLSLLDEQIQSVTIEGIGNDEKGVDVWVQRKDGIREAQQRIGDGALLDSKNRGRSPIGFRKNRGRKNRGRSPIGFRGRVANLSLVRT